MKQLSKSSPFPWLALLAGAMGLTLRIGLLSCADAEGLLPRNHITGILLLILFAAVMIALGLILRKAGSDAAYPQLFPASPPAAICSMVGAVGMGISSFTIAATPILRILIIVLGILWAAGVVLASYCRLQKRKPHYLFYGFGVLFFAIRAILFYRVFGSEPQLQLYLFEILASIALLLTAYYRTELTVGSGHCRLFVFFSQTALFCCCVCLRGQDLLFWVSAILYLAADCCVLPAPKVDD